MGRGEGGRGGRWCASAEVAHCAAPPRKPTYSRSVLSLGALARCSCAAQCALGQFPYTAYATAGSNYFVLLSQILNDPPPQLPAESFSAEFRDFVLLCLCKEPENRPSAESLLQHPFIRRYDDALRPFDMAGFVRTVTEMRMAAGAAPS